ncbi:hypothetical protein HMPREF0083_00304 [Aneurinibacillus aneurinilyticus ATCC 12856]|uniref:Uncharacterized protein n=1 Tax=Aneurinibacillus aneurinilyticus ATCC 12856 TaxID=649747 RepID=U1X9E9_ANEAE|nr:hypothetical protein HMPREF0083_00304 [Aneurinibacillus aneurinilyticus ATCC 12856]
MDANSERSEEEERCTRRRVPSSFSHKEETQPLCGAKAGPAKSGLAVPPGWGKKRSSTLRGGRRTDARLGHGVVTTHSGSY